MPELPDVEAYKHYIEVTSLHKKICDAAVKSPEMLLDLTSEDFERLLRGKEFQGCRRHGKYLFTELQPTMWLMFHFGMTGDLKYFKTTEEVPRFTRLLVCFENGFSLVFLDQRKLGKIAVMQSLEGFVKKRSLGPDALQIDFPAFKAMTAESRGAIKGTLLNQHKVAGIGNIYADEILYQTRLHPQAKTCALEEQDVRQLYNNMRRILQTAIKHNADSARFPSMWLIPSRVKGGRCPRCSGTIATAKVAGRTAYFCPDCQKLTVKLA